MAFDIALLILFIALFSLILFREEITSFFKERAKTKKEKADETFPFPGPEKQHDKTTLPSEEKPERRVEAPQEQRKKVDEQKSRLSRIEALEAARKKQKERTEVAKKPAPKPKPTAPEKTKPNIKREPAPISKPHPVEKPAPKPAPRPKAPQAAPEKVYPDFDNSRLLGMGLSQKDADDFVLELIEQIDDHIPKIEAAIGADDFENVERLTHSLKGSATNLGTGGVADQLIEFNTYCKSGKNKEKVENYLASLKTCQAKLKKQFG